MGTTSWTYSTKEYHVIYINLGVQRSAEFGRYSMICLPAVYRTIVVKQCCTTRHVSIKKPLDKSAV